MNDNINIGDTVLYTDTETQHDGKRLSTVKVIKWGVWDGEKVVLNDPEKTTVRNKAWLTVTHEKKYLPTEELLNELVNLGASLELSCSKEESASTCKEIDEINSIILSRIT